MDNEYISLFYSTTKKNRVLFVLACSTNGPASRYSPSTHGLSKTAWLHDTPNIKKKRKCHHPSMVQPLPNSSRTSSSSCKCDSMSLLANPRLPPTLSSSWEKNKKKLPRTKRCSTLAPRPLHGAGASTWNRHCGLDEWVTKGMGSAATPQH
jgi:hypothetical protein